MRAFKKRSGLMTWGGVTAMALALLGTASCARTTPPPSSSVAASEQIAQANGIQIAYRIVGADTGIPIVLIGGTGMQLIDWTPALIDGLVAKGFRVIVFDNRDAGRSTHFTAAGAPDWPAIFAALGAGKPAPLPYTAQDMATDTIALMSAVGLSDANIFGISGGATVAELVAIAAPARVRSLTLVMANSGDPQIPMPADPKRTAGIPQGAATDTPAQSIERLVATYTALTGRKYPIGPDEARAMATRYVERDPDPLAYQRQGAAMLVLGDLRPRLAAIKAPTVVIHGSDDPLLSPRTGETVARTIPGARFVLIDGLGHDLPASVAPQIVAEVASVAK